MNATISRRNFVRSGAIAAVAGAPILSTIARPSAALAEPSHAPTGEPPVRIGLCSYTFRNFTRAQMIPFLKQLHVTGLNVKDTKDHLPMDPGEEAKALTDYAAAGIHLHAAGTVYFPKDEDDDIRAKFEYAKRAGIPVIVAGDPTPATLPRLEKFVKEYDIKIAIHNHGPEDKIWPSPFDVLRYLKNFDTRLGICMDVGHSVRAGADVVEAIHAAGPRLHDVHFKDLTDFTSRESQVAVGQGLMPVRAIFEALIQTKYPGWVDLEYEINGDNPMPGVIESVAYMRGGLAGLGYPSHA